MIDPSAFSLKRFSNISRCLQKVPKYNPEISLYFPQKVQVGFLMSKYPCFQMNGYDKNALNLCVDRHFVICHTAILKLDVALLSMSFGMWDYLIEMSAAPSNLNKNSFECKTWKQKHFILLIYNVQDSDPSSMYEISWNQMIHWCEQNWKKDC